MVHVRHVFVRTESTSNSMKKTEIDRYLHRLHTYRDDSFDDEVLMKFTFGYVHRKTRRWVIEFSSHHTEESSRLFFDTESKELGFTWMKSPTDNLDSFVFCFPFTII